MNFLRLLIQSALMSIFIVGISAITYAEPIQLSSVQLATLKQQLNDNDIKNVAIVIMMNNEQKKQGLLSWTPFAIKCGLFAGACYLFDYYLLGGRTIKHITKKTDDILAAIAKLRTHIDGRFDKVDTDIHTLAADVKQIMKHLEIKPNTTKERTIESKPTRLAMQPETNINPMPVYSWWHPKRYLPF